MDKRTSLSHFFPIFTAIVMLGLVMAGCQKTDTTQPEESQPPEIPPASTFLMDFDDFPDTAKISMPGGNSFNKTQTRQNWGWAALNVGVWNTLLTLTFAVPVAAFVESFNHEPEQQDDGSWVWTYTFRPPGGVLHTAELHASLVSEGIQWEMYISKQNVYSDFLWYSGLSAYTGREGSWTLYHNPTDPTPFLGIEWHRNPLQGTADIKYTNIVPNHPENGGYIFYGIVNSNPYDAFYDIYNKGQDNHTNIEWDRTSKAGRVKDPLHFGDADWHCWDTLDNDLQDIDCP